jgi:hypothetical protein
MPGIDSTSLARAAAWLLLTIGAVHDFLTARWARLGIGGDVTLYHMSSDMLPYFEGSRSFHAFARWRPNGASARHVH